jgi:hypothetical protein
VVGGDLRVRGEITGDAVVYNGNLILEETGLVQGDALVTNGQIVNEGGRVRGEMLSVNGSSRTAASANGRTEGDGSRNSEAGVSEGDGSRGDVSETDGTQNLRSDARNSGGSFRSIRRGIAGIVSTLALALVLAGIGASLVFFLKPNLETVSDTIRNSTARAAATGIAGAFLVIPAFIVLIVTLAVSIIGIPLLLVAIPLYPLAAFAALVFGLVATAHALGERTAEQNRGRLRLPYRNSYSYVFVGIGILLLPMIASYLITMTGFLAFVGILLFVVTILAHLSATTVGFGAVILSWAGRRRTYAGASPLAGGPSDDPFFDDPILGDFGDPIPGDNDV